METMSSSSSPRILVVEDEVITALDIESELIALGYQVIGLKHNAADAIEAGIVLKPDVILMDIRLGNGPDGIYAADQIIKHHNAAVIFISAQSDEKTFSDASKIGPYPFIVKPFRTRDIKGAIEVALSKRLADHNKIKTLKRSLLQAF